MPEREPRLIAVMGPTASGKTALAEQLAEQLDATLVNGDAFQVYRGMDIGTAKPVDRTRYRLLDLKEPSEGFGVGEWVSLASAEAEAAYTQGRDVVVVGGSGLYIRALFEGYRDLKPSPDPELRSHLMTRLETEGLPSLVAELRSKSPEVVIDEANPARIRRALERLATPAEPLEFELPPFLKSKLAIDIPVAENYARIAGRIDSMLAAGWLDEVQSLVKRGFGPADPGFRALGYCDLWHVLIEKGSLKEARESIVRETRRYAKRQRTWMRREPRVRSIGWGDAAELFRRALAELSI